MGGSGGTKGRVVLSAFKLVVLLRVRVCLSFPKMDGLVSNYESTGLIPQACYNSNSMSWSGA